MTAEKPDGWIGVDLDGTLAKRRTTYHPHAIGDPIELMVKRVCAWLDAGREVRIFTARVSHGDPLVEKAIRAWCLRHIGCELQVTNVKDHLMDELWDDRAVSVEVDTGRDMRTPDAMEALAREIVRLGHRARCDAIDADGRYIGEVESLPGCVAYGATEAEAKSNARTLAVGVIMDRARHGEL